jgi:putative iron-dependent peroxidase
MSNHQPAILAPLARAGRFVTLSLLPDAPAGEVRTCLASLQVGPGTIVGLGEPLVRALGARVEGLHSFQAVCSAGSVFPSTQGALWLCFDGDDPGELVHRARAAITSLAPHFRVEEDLASFVYGSGRDLSGYEDGTENPKQARAGEVALVAGGPLAGSSFVAVQRWVHDLAHLERMSPKERDHVIGRERTSNVELPDAPPSAHVKRAAQESFAPAAFMLRRSMPWGDAREHGLYFVAFGASLDPFERVLRRMAGNEDGIADGLLRFSRAVTGGAYWCPPLRDGRLDLRAVA